MPIFPEPDPSAKLVLALRINEFTMQYYLRLPLPQEKKHFSYEEMLGNYIVIPVLQPQNWGWLEYDVFHESYTPIEDWRHHRYTYCIPK